MKGREVKDFGERLAHVRRSKAMTQVELGKKVGLSDRMISYYERENAQPPGPILADIARALRVTTDELLGLKAFKHKADPKSARLINRLKKVENLPPSDQRAVLKFIEALVATRGKGNGA